MKKQKKQKGDNAFRIGIGYDVHRLAKGRKLILGGIHIPSTFGLFGHSDADVLLHAICDSLLGAVALGDIGKHFPDTDAKFRGISSLFLLEKVGLLVQKEGYVIGNIDSTIILQKPKIGDYIDGMSDKIGSTLKISPQQVSIKATTHEKIGTLGRGEGCAALAIALLISKSRI
jgi:2-C-methyl-D-erythritol 2,4-cyclodiphosphate synthase